MKQKLCKCLNCDAVMVDENPGGQPELPVPDNVDDMEQIDDNGSFFWGCPNCKTDEHLVDLFAYP
jgi:hypothetical protein